MVPKYIAIDDMGNAAGPASIAQNLAEPVSGAGARLRPEIR